MRAVLEHFSLEGAEENNDAAEVTVYCYTAARLYADFVRSYTLDIATWVL